MKEINTIKNRAKARNKANKIASIVCLAFVGVLILTTILLAIIPVYTSVKLTNKPDEIYLRINSTYYEFSKDGNPTDYDRVMNAYYKGGSSSVIASIFGGYAGKGMKSNYTTSSTSFTSLSDSETFEVIFVWKNEQTMINPDGSEFKYQIGDSDSWNSPSGFKEIHFAIASDNEVKDHTFYIKTSESNYTRYTYTGVANYNGLYNVLNEMVEEGKFTPFA